MKTVNSFCDNILLLFFLVAFLFYNCSGGDSGGLDDSPNTQTQINVSDSPMSFGEVFILTNSVSQSLPVSGSNLSAPIDVTVSGPYEISTDNNNFSSALQVATSTEPGNEALVYVRFNPTTAGLVVGELNLQSLGVPTVSITLTGTGKSVVHNYTVFNQQALGFGGGFSQSATQLVNLHDDLSFIQEIKMFLEIECPNTGCDDWDRFANVSVKDPATGNWYEIGRYITPYWVGTQQLERGLEFDVTDFKSLLSGQTEIRIYIENWTTKADLISVEFDYIEGTPDYSNYAVSEVLGYHSNSISGVPYGVSHDYDLDKSIQLPSNTESAHLRTVISGWGHATPPDVGGRACAEWCFRTHNILINGSTSFQHYMGPIGCASNPINNQSPGNWMPDRAGWCPGMAVPVRSNSLNLENTNFSFEYDFQDWTSDGGNGNAFYATAVYVVVKSNTEISAPTVLD